MISATIITRNEEKNILRCLSALSWVDEIIVVDSGSTDRTVELAKQVGAKVTVEPWRGYGAQKNFAMGLCQEKWVLNVDADEVVTAELKQEILEILQSQKASKIEAYQVARKTFFCNRWIRYGGWYPNYVTRLCLRESGRWTEPAVHEELKVQGEVGKLKEPLLHYTFQGIEDQVLTNVRYAKQGAAELKRKGRRFHLVNLLMKPLVKFMECYIFKAGFLDGLPGFIIAINAAHSMFMKQAFLSETTEERGHT